ncbi:uncharacterized protein [Eurosta solidaginis]|uniref:uncharacterized protein n=1 Tax=Eurosta solidaginis TaxID=178769 RepID=UPI003530589C
MSESDCFAKPKCFNVNNEISEVIVKGRCTLDESKVQGCIMPIHFQIRKFFELPSVLDTVLRNMEILSKEYNITHFINSTSFKEKTQFYNGKIIVPFFIYLDSFEINNPLGIHANVDSICGVYYSFPVLPQYLLSNLSYIFVAAYFKSNDQKVFGNDPFLKPLIEEFRDLEENGMLIKTKSGFNQLHFVCNVLGGNLGLNDILGFTTSFSSNYYCRFCNAYRGEMMRDLVEHPENMRTKDNYNAALMKNDAKLTGIKSNFLFNELATFHVTTNFSVYIVHDLYEGVCRYDICEILKYFISEKQFFSIETFNYRKQMFNYGECAIGNMSPPLDLLQITSNKMKMSAREMMTFIHFLPLIIGDLVPREDDIWSFL